MQFTRQQLLRQLFFDHRDELELVLLRRLRCPETASDLLQEAFVRLCRSQDLEQIGNLKAYLFRIALNLVNDHFRSQKVREIIVHEEPDSLYWHEDRRHRDGETLALDQERLALFVRKAETDDHCRPRSRRRLARTRSECRSGIGVRSNSQTRMRFSRSVTPLIPPATHRINLVAKITTDCSFASIHCTCNR
ncbi:MAG: hypothetical protein L0Y43_10765 [Methylococcaceae bacterium]|nr:hypothetical protein [Methylococcaceae bacterium]